MARTRAEIERYVKQHPEKKAEIYTPYTVVQRKEKDLEAIPAPAPTSIDKPRPVESPPEVVVPRSGPSPAPVAASIWGEQALCCSQGCPRGERFG